MNDPSETGEQTASKRRELHMLLMRLFRSAEELRRFVQLSSVRGAFDEVTPGPFVQRVFDLIEVLEASGQVNREFFLALARERPQQAHELRRVATLWQVELAATASPTAPSASTAPGDPAQRRTRFAVLSAIAVMGGTLGVGFALTREPAPTSDQWPPPGDPAAPPGMLRFAGGTFGMGSTPEEVRDASERCLREQAGVDCDHYFLRETPVREVAVAPFDLDVVEVSAGDFAAWLNGRADLTTTPDSVQIGGVRVLGLDLDQYSGIRLHAGRFEPIRGLERRPVTMVTWEGGALYCRDMGKRLPSEAEWEFAARGTERRIFPPGAAVLGCGDAIFGRDPGGIRAQVGAVPSSPGPCSHLPKGPAIEGTDRTPEGIEGLGGNVREWVEDRWLAANDGGATERAIRGCGWNEPAVLCRAARRSHDETSYAGVAIGFRCARTPESSARRQ